MVEQSNDFLQQSSNYSLTWPEPLQNSKYYNEIYILEDRQFVENYWTIKARDKTKKGNMKYELGKPRIFPS